MIKFRNVLALVATLAAINASSAEPQSIILASTTSVEASGLLANILPQFTAKTGITVNVVAQGTGKALDTARRGDADLLLVHDPEAEQAFMDEGHGSTRRQIAWNDFIIVGPSADPAHVKGGSDSVAALKAIAASQAPFVSRGDKSGTNAAELRLWKIAGQTPDVLNKEKWYRDIGGGMGQALNAASAMDAYTLSDRGTWLSFGNKGSLVVAIEGDPRLINRYDVIELNPAEARGRKARRCKGVRRLAGFVRGAASDRRVSSERPKTVQPVRRFAEITRFQFSAELLFFATAGRRSAPDLARSGSARGLRTRVEPRASVCTCLRADESAPGLTFQPLLGEFFVRDVFQRRQALRHFRVVKFIAAQPAPLKAVPEQDGVHLPGKFMNAPRPVSLDHFAGRIERQAV